MGVSSLWFLQPIHVLTFLPLFLCDSSPGCTVSILVYPIKCLDYGCLSTCACQHACTPNTNLGRTKVCFPHMRNSERKQSPKTSHPSTLQQGTAKYWFLLYPLFQSDSAIKLSTIFKEVKRITVKHIQTLFPCKKHTFSNSVLFCNEESVWN